MCAAAGMNVSPVKHKGLAHQPQGRGDGRLLEYVLGLSNKERCVYKENVSGSLVVRI